jgi:hypothetical protein
VRGSQHERSFAGGVFDMTAILRDYCQMVCALTCSGGTEEDFIILGRFESAREPANSFKHGSTKHYAYGVCHVIDL